MRPFAVCLLLLLACGVARAAEPDALPPGALARLGTNSLRYPGVISGLTYSPDGKLIVAAGYGPAVVVFDAVTGKEVRSLPTRGPAAPGAQFSPDGKRLLVGGSGEVLVWDTATWKEAMRLKTDGTASKVAFLDGGKRIVAFDPREDNSFARCVWDAETGVELDRKGARQGGWRASISPDGRYMDAGAVITRTDTGAEVMRLKAAGNYISAASFSADGRRIAYYTGGKFHIGDLEANKEVKVFPGPSYSEHPPNPVLSPDGSLVAIFGYMQLPGQRFTELGLAVYDVETGKERFKSGDVRPWHRNNTNSHMAFSPDGKTLAVAVGSMIDLWDVAAGKRREMPGNDESARAVTDIQVSADGKLAATYTAEEDTARLWDLETGKLLFRLPVRTTFIAFSTDGKLLASGYDRGDDARLILWDASTGKESVKLVEKGQKRIEFGTFLDKDQKLATVATDGTLSIWNLADRKIEKEIKAPFKRVLNATADGKTIAVQSSEAMGLWDLETLRNSPWTHPHAELRYSNVPVPVVAPDALMLAGVRYTEQAAWTYDLENARYAVSRLPARVTQTSILALAPGKKFLAVADKENDEVRLFNAKTGQPTSGLHTGQGKTSYLTFAPDGSKLLTAGAGGGVIVWDVAKLPPRPSGEGRISNPAQKWNLLVSYPEEASKNFWDLVEGGPATVKFLKGKLRPVPADAVIPKFPPGEWQREQKGIDILESIGTDEAKELLKALAGGHEDAPMTKAAKAALGRLEKR